MYNITLAI